MNAVDRALARGEIPIVMVKEGKSANNPCFDCEHAIRGCEWSKDFEEVPGWKAELVKLDQSATYHILECPLFEETPARRSGAGVMSTEENELFLRDPIAYLEQRDHPLARRIMKKMQQQRKEDTV